MIQHLHLRFKDFEETSTVWSNYLILKFGGHCYRFIIIIGSDELQNFGFQEVKKVAENHCLRNTTTAEEKSLAVKH